jgi:hypothetical protein
VKGTRLADSLYVMPSPRTLRWSTAIAFAVASLSLQGDATARPAPVIVTVVATTPIRVQIAFAPTNILPCDSPDNVMLFDGVVDPRVGLALNVDAVQLCVRHTYDDFPEGNWAESRFWTRPGCRRLPCVQGADPTLRIALDGRAW